MIANEGWVKVYRKTEDSVIWQCPHLFRLAMYCLLKANYLEKKWLIPGTNDFVTVPRGGFITGRHSLHKGLYPKKKSGDPGVMSLWRKLHVLEKSGFISVQNLSNRASLVTVCNYLTYQDDLGNGCATDEQPVSNRRATDEQPVSTTKESKKVRMEESNKKEGADAQSRFVPPSVPEVAAYCSERGNAVDPEKFVDHYSAKGWMIGKNKMKDWRAAVRTWEPPKPKSKCPDFEDLLKPGAIQ